MNLLLASTRIIRCRLFKNSLFLKQSDQFKKRQFILSKLTIDEQHLDSPWARIHIKAIKTIVLPVCAIKWILNSALIHIPCGRCIVIHSAMSHIVLLLEPFFTKYLDPGDMAKDSPKVLNQLFEALIDAEFPIQLLFIFHPRYKGQNQNGSLHHTKPFLDMRKIHQCINVQMGCSFWHIEQKRYMKVALEYLSWYRLHEIILSRHIV